MSLGIIALGINISDQGVSPQKNKIEAIFQIGPPPTRKQ